MYGLVLTYKVTPTAKGTVVTDIKNIKGLSDLNAIFALAMSDPRTKCRLFYNPKVNNGVTYRD